MKKTTGILLLAVVCAAGLNVANADNKNTSQAANSPPDDRTGNQARYRLEKEGDLPVSIVTEFRLTIGPVELRNRNTSQWIQLDSTKADGTRFQIWILCSDYPPRTLAEAKKSTLRYILQEGESRPLEFRHQFTGEAVLPSVGGWQHLFPRQSQDPNNTSSFAAETEYLGHHYRLEKVEPSQELAVPSNIDVLDLLPDVLVGVPHNTRQKDETRRYDDSDYELIPLTREDFNTMIESGMNCLKVDPDQIAWVDRRNVFYWGVGGTDVPFPECLYRSNYLGPSLFLDEPAVGTRDHVIRPRLAKDPEFRKTITPQIVLEEFKEYFDRANNEGTPVRFLNNLAQRPDVDLGGMSFVQQNLYSWETMVSTAVYQLSRNEHSPSSIVFEPPGRVGTRRTLPELNMTYGCQIPTDSPKNLTSIIYGFLRGAAKLTDKSWGASIYGSVDRADSFWFLTHAYDLGARHFFFWDTHRLACVPFNECLTLAKNLRRHAENFPDRDLEKLKKTAEVAILLPPGYNLGHVHLGKGSLWGLGELNLERINRKGAKYRVVMNRFFTEIERFLRQGVAFDLLWDLPETSPTGYREVVRIREDGKVEIIKGDHRTVLEQARTPQRPEGLPPQLSVQLSAVEGISPLEISARATVVETETPVYYTFGANPEGVYENAKVGWEIYGPGKEDYRYLIPARRKLSVREKDGRAEVEIQFKLMQPGNYRLRAAVVDIAGRSTIRWTNIVVTE